MTVNLKSFDLGTKQGKLFKALVLDRETLSEATIAKRFGIKNPTATISVIRSRGFAIYANNCLILLDFYRSSVDQLSNLFQAYLNENW